MNGRHTMSTAFDDIRKGMEEGCDLIIGGPGKPEGLETGYFVKPTVFTGVTNDKTIAREEIFGPVLAIIGYEGLDEAVEIAKGCPTFELDGTVEVREVLPM